MMVVDATLISIKVVLIAVITTFILTLIAVWGIGLNKHKSIRSLDFIFLLPLFIPPSAIGYLILIILG